MSGADGSGSRRVSGHVAAIGYDLRGSKLETPDRRVAEMCSQLQSMFVAAAVAIAVLSATSAHAQERPTEPDRQRYTGLFGTAGVGAPELAHAEVGYYLLDRLAIEAQYKWSIWNHLTGLGVTGHFWGVTRRDGPPRTSAIAGASALVNPTLGEVTFSSRGDEIGAVAIAYLGFALVSDDGWMFRAAGGPMVYDDPGFPVHPTFHLGLGFAP